MRPLTCEAGDVIMFDSNCMHASAENPSPLGRRNLFIVYNAVRNRLHEKPYAAARPRPRFLAPALTLPPERQNQALIDEAASGASPVACKPAM